MICNLEVVGSTPSIGSISKTNIPGEYQSGQMGQTVNLLVFTFGGSNPSSPTIAEEETTSNKRGSYNGYYASLPSWKWEFDSPTPLKDLPM